ncbi:hypothetical protein [Streptomyces sp. NPDC018000]|uniref:hypothetical protein n=1 Tax=Streptomyces sp. NPDC018000 TaxID=3365028 RepID=UPI003793572A
MEYNATVTRHEVLTFTWTLRESGGRALYTASGTCIQCGCPMTRTFPSVQPPVPKGGGFLGRREDPGPGTWRTTCRCTSLHMPRPANEPQGCGALLTLAPPPVGLVAQAGPTP